MEECQFYERKRVFEKLFFGRQPPDPIFFKFKNKSIQLPLLCPRLNPSRKINALDGLGLKN